jgi:hypothetical protein
MISRKLLAALFAGLLLLGACSSDDNPDEASSDDTSVDDTTDPTDLGDLGDLGDLDDLGDLGDLGDVAGLGGECVEFSLGYASVFLGSFAALGGADDAEVEEYLDSISELDASVPGEIEDDFAIVSEAYAEYFQVLADDGFASDGAAEATEAIDSDEVTEAQENIDAWLAENCG